MAYSDFGASGAEPDDQAPPASSCHLFDRSSRHARRESDDACMLRNTIDGTGRDRRLYLGWLGSRPIPQEGCIDGNWSRRRVLG